MSYKFSRLSTFEMESARDVQSRFLPYRLPAIPGFDYCGDSRQAAEVGGDFFDFVVPAQERLTLSVGDVSGHGVASAIVMSGMQAMLRGLSSAEHCDLGDVVRQLNRTVYDIAPEGFLATLFYASIDGHADRLSYVSAGHEPALLLRANGNAVQRLDSTGAVLGLTPRAAYRCRHVMMDPGDILVAFTDGIPEAMDPDGRELQIGGIAEVLRRNRGARASELVSLIMDAAGAEEPVDDRTVVVVRRVKHESRPLRNEKEELCLTLVA